MQVEKDNNVSEHNLLPLEVVLKGFEGSTDDTDHLVKWYWVDSRFVPEVIEVCCEVEASCYPMTGMDIADAGFDAIITTREELQQLLVEIRNTLTKDMSTCIVPTNRL